MHLMNESIIRIKPRCFTGKSVPKRQGGAKVRTNKWKTPGYVRGLPKKLKGFDFDFSSVAPSPSGEDMSMLDPETGALILSDRNIIAPEELPYSPEQWYYFRCA